ncbi:phenazine biosynthesis FMN-dependent oxidase PhzG [Actinospica durhamensis]|uniref:Phenazine biosynthesis FMN-dependent oxidase PhzG n=1 Tax=Actinospica durhamensis TaxID=1508375 RepID=A0A941EI45_9ACTN|nr:phenazine biosynthesis FMN-dependent oxidase PhzG [Actinospica durhamensis]MBR7831902.1 phenazine biosynthesis FMN-dependent oxidase PhzG [Actinospica durhamensis]
MSTTSRFESLTGQVDLDFPEYDAPPPEPLGLLHSWLAAAAEAGVREPRALALATADARGHASNRIVAISAVTERGLLFLSHTTSLKGRQLAETGWASGLLYWRETGRQVIVSGPCRPVRAEEADRLWFARPIPMHAMSTASRQSDPLEDVEGLRTEANRLEDLGVALERPPRFTGYFLEPAQVEFWSAAADRLHRRLRYDLVDGRWQAGRLQP